MLKWMKKYSMVLMAGLLLAGAVYVNVGLEKPAEPAAAEAAQTPAPTPAADAAAGDYFADFRAEREAVREAEMGYLEEVIAASANDDETLAEAQQHKLALVDNMEKEFTIESLIKAKGFADAAVTFHKGAVNVVVDGPELGSEQVAQILDIVCRETGESAENIKVIPQG